MKTAGYILIGFGLLLFGMIVWYIPLALVVVGVAMIDLDNHYKF